jgi:hypothetical protein
VPLLLLEKDELREREVVVGMSKPFRGKIDIDIKDSGPDWKPYSRPMASR